jgi:Bacterial Ig-like domain (group 3)/FG-GAP-like repeat
LYPFSLEADSVGVRLGNGDGTFQSESFYGTGGSNGASSVVAADVNLDGNLDLLFVNDTNFLGAAGVLLGNGDGTFQRVKTYASHGSQTGGPGLAVVDVNGDGNSDLLVADFAGYCTPNCGGAVDVLLGNGNGTFRSVVSYSSGAYGAQSVAVGDLNGDGEPDVVLANQDPSPFGGPGIVAVLLQRARTSVALTSSLNPSIYGQKVTWTARVTSSGSITPTGKVNFTWNGYSIGSATLNVSGVATLTKSNLNADPYPLTAVYSGDVNNLGSTSAIVNQVVTETTSAAKITSTPNPSTLGQAVTFLATITSPTVIPTGPVTFMVATKVLGTAQLSSGKAKFTTSTLPVGSTKVTAIYYGDSNIAKSSASVVQTVQ